MYYIGIDLGGTSIAAGIVDENGKIIKKDSVPTKHERGAEAVCLDMAKLAENSWLLAKRQNKEILDSRSK